MDRRWIVPRGVLGALSLFLVSGLIAPALADPIRPWAGAGVEIHAAGDVIRAEGATAASVDEGVSEFTYYHSGDPEIGTLHGAFPRRAEARAGKSAGELLQVATRADQPNLGSRPAMLSGGPTHPYSMASWTGDAIRVASPSHGSPDSIRVTMGLDLTLGGWGWHELGGQFGSVDLAYQGQTISLAGQSVWGDTWSEEYWDRLANAWVAAFESAGLQGVSVTPGDSYNAPDVSGTITFDLMIDEAGVSDPLRLSLSSHPEVMIFGNRPYLTTHDATLSLLDLTLPDGTPLHEAGYSVTFDSGLAWPQPVPEPAPIALLGAGMALVGWKRWRKRAGA